MKKYQKDLKSYREFKANQILKDDLIDKFGLRKSLLSQIALIQNRTRGKVFEIMGEVCVKEAFDVKDFDRQSSFETPFGLRKIDIFDKEKGLIIEVKSGYARSKLFVRKQIQKDAYLVKYHSDIKKAIWVCFRGATKPLINYLKQYKIDYYDVGYDKMEIDFGEKSIVRV